VSADGAAARPAVRWERLLALAGIYVVVAHLLPSPASVTAEQWRQVGVFFATVGGLMLQPLPGSQVVLLGLTAMLIVGGVPLDRALDGYSAPTVWMVLAAMLMSRALRDCGLARRVALWFVRAIGGTSLGLGYSLHLTDLTLATGVPSITARSASIVFPIARSISGLYKSHPGASSAVLGGFLMTCMYQGSVISSAMFFYSSAANLLLGEMAAEFAGVTITWTSWFTAGLLPGVVSSLVVPYLVYRTLPPTLTRTPAASSFANTELRALGPIRGREAVVAATFIGLIVFWVISAWVDGLSPTLVAFVGLTVLFVTGALDWGSALDERSAWDVFVWYGGLLTMGGVLNDTGVATIFATWFGSWFSATSWVVVFLVTLVVYFYTHYFFASTTVHALAMYHPFLAMLVGLGAPAPVVVYSLVFVNNLMAGLTHYGTTTSPIIFVEGYVSLHDWWRVGFYASAVNLAIWLTVGMLWWKVLGLW
jgi:DASS family divalent anion:Na+ symporter